MDPERDLLVTVFSTGAVSSLSGVPSSVTFVSGETLQQFVVSGVDDADLAGWSSGTYVECSIRKILVRC